MNEKLEFLAGLVSLDGPISPNDATLFLEYDYEFGWTCGYKGTSGFVICQFIICVQTGATAEEAVNRCYDQAKTLFVEKGDHP